MRISFMAKVQTPLIKPKITEEMQARIIKKATGREKEIDWKAIAKQSEISESKLDIFLNLWEESNKVVG